MQQDDFTVDDPRTLRRLAQELTAPGITQQDYDDLARVMHAARQQGTSREVTAGRIRDRLPQFSLVADDLIAVQERAHQHHQWTLHA